MFSDKGGRGAETTGYMNLKFYNLIWLIYFSLFLKIFYEFFYLSLLYIFVLKSHLSLSLSLSFSLYIYIYIFKTVTVNHFLNQKRKRKENWLFSKKEKENNDLNTVRAFPSNNSIIFYFTISKNYFINYAIPFYNTLNILTFILLYYTLK